APLKVSGSLIASRNDPWMRFDKAADLAQRWGLALHDAGAAGHINPESGYGPWPLALQLASAPLPRMPLANSALKRGRGSVLAAVRQMTRQQLERPHNRRLRPLSALQKSE